MGAWFTQDEDVEPSLGVTQGLNELINVGSVLLSGEEFTALVQKLHQEWKPPLVTFRCWVANVLALEGGDRVFPGWTVVKLNSCAMLCRLIPVTEWMSWETILDRILTSMLLLLAKFWKKEIYWHQLLDRWERASQMVRYINVAGPGNNDQICFIQNSIWN